MPAASPGLPCREAKDGVIVHLRVTPKSGADQIGGLYQAADGQVSLKVRVRAQPEKGKANKAVIKILAKALGVAKSQLSLVSGATSHNKSVHIPGRYQHIAQQIKHLI